MAEGSSVVQQLGTNGPDWYVAGAIFLSALVGAIIALVVVAQQRISAKKKNAYDMVLTLFQPDLAECDRIFSEVAKTNNWQQILSPIDDEQVRIKQRVELFLNHFEFLCVSIRQNIVDEDVIKAIVGDTLVKRLASALPLINMIRNDEKDPEFFEHFEHVAERWKKNPKIQKRNPILTILREIRKV